MQKHYNAFVQLRRHAKAGIRRNMKRLSMLMALGVMATLVLFGADSASAKSGSTTKQTNKSTVVIVKAGDTLESIAAKHHTTYVRLFNANKHIANPNIIDVGDKVRIPAKKTKLKDRFASYKAQAVAPAATYTTQQYTSAPVNSSSYYIGNGMWCTDYVHSKRPDVAIYGNAGYNWISAAQADGMQTGSSPRVGAIAVTNGHVAYVERVNADGSYVVSEMGWNYQAGNFNRRTVQPGTFGGFIY
jgi:surface antigen